MKFNILLLDGVDAICAQTFEQRDINAHTPGKISRDQLLSIIGQYDGLVVRSATSVDEELLKHALKLKVIGRAGVGVDNIDINAATQKGILVMNTPDGNTISTAEHTCGMILALSRNIPKAVNKMKNNGWDRKKYMGTEVYGKTLGIIGLGKIGTELARRMSAFGMEIIAYDPFSTQEHAQEIGVELVDLDEVLKKADFLSVHTPLTEKTKGLVSLKNAAKLKSGMRLVNCARGGIYEEAHLIELIDKGIIAGAALDVYTQEPPTEELYKILSHPKIICTPHLGASTEEAQEKVALQIALQMADALEEKNFKGSLNGNSIALMANKEVQPYLEMAEKLGHAVAQLSANFTHKLEFEYSGDCIKYADILTDGILKGLLSEYIDDVVNLINARVFAESRGIVIREVKNNKIKTYKDLITVRISEKANYNSISAAIFGLNDYRIVEINDFSIEFHLNGDIVLYQNIDKPGMLASVSGALAKQDINIAALSLGRSGKGSFAITAVSVDKKLNEDEIKIVEALDGIKNTRFLSFS